MLTDYEIISEFQENYRYAHDFWAPFVTDANVYTLAASGYTWSTQERETLQKEGREPLELNIMRRPLQFFSGYLRDNLNSVVVAPVEGSDQKTADQFTKLQYYIWDKGGGYNTFLDAADEGFKSGISLCGIYMDYSKDFINGDISFFKRTFNSFYLDPTFENIDLNDCAFAITRDLLDKNIIKSLLPFIEASVIDGIYGSFRDNKFLNFHPNFSNISRNRNLMAYDQYYRRTTRTRKFLIDTRTDHYRDVTELDKDELKKLNIGVYRINKLAAQEAEESGESKKDLLYFKDVDRDFVELNIMLNGQRVYCGEDKTGIVDTYPFAPILGYMEPSIWMPSQRLQGIASTLYSAQRQFNKRHMKIVDMMDSTISTGYKYMIGSVADVSDLQQSGQNKIIGIDPENAPEGMNSVQELQAGGANPALIEYQSILDQLTLTLANVNESVLGIDDKGNTQISGRLAQVRVAQGLRSNRKIFDNVEVSQLVVAGLVLNALQKKYSPGKIERILGEKPTDQFYDNDFEQYDAVLKEGIRSKSQRDAYYYELVNLKREGIIDVPQDYIAEYLPGTGTTDLLDQLKAQQEAQKAQQEKINEQERLAMELGNAEVEQKLSLAQERRARVISDIALSESRSSEAEQNRAKAALDRAKTITEIAGMETDHLLRVAEFVKTLEQDEIIDRERVSNTIFEKADQINSETSGSAENKQVEASQELNMIGDELT